MHRVAIVGAGAMGCLFAARLALAGVDVTVIDVDRARQDLLAQDGICLHDDQGARTARVAACTADAAVGPFDLLILFTKGMHSTAAMQSVAHLQDGHCAVLTLQNGLGNVEAIARVFALDRIVWGVTDYPADLESPAHAASHGAGHIALGGAITAADGHAHAACALLKTAGLNAVFDPHVDQAIWEKVAFNAALNSLSTITGLPVGGLDCNEGRAIAAAVADEAIATAHALGTMASRDRLQARIDFAMANHRNHKPSMLQDRLAGRSTEIATINVAIVAAAQQSGVPTPTIRLLGQLVAMGDRPASATV